MDDRYERLKEYPMSQEVAFHDPLTGAFTSSPFLIIAQQTLALARRFGMDLSIIVIDIDGFEAVNERLGRETGDQMLRDLGQFFREFLRDADLFCRCVDNDFIILLPGADLEGASQVAEGLRGHAYSELLVENLRSLSPTFSIGIAEMNYNLDKKIESLVERAMEALRRAKEQGKDKVCVCLPQEGDSVDSPGEGRP